MQGLWKKGTIIDEVGRRDKKPIHARSAYKITRATCGTVERCTARPYSRFHLAQGIRPLPDVQCSRGFDVVCAWLFSWFEL